MAANKEVPFGQQPGQHWPAVAAVSGHIAAYTSINAVWAMAPIGGWRGQPVVRAFYAGPAQRRRSRSRRWASHMIQILQYNRPCRLNTALPRHAQSPALFKALRHLHVCVKSAQLGLFQGPKKPRQKLIN